MAFKQFLSSKIAIFGLLILFIYNYRDYFPWTIFYKVFTDDIERWHKKLKKDNIPVVQNHIQMLDEMVDKMKDEIEKMKESK